MKKSALALSVVLSLFGSLTVFAQDNGEVSAYSLNEASPVFAKDTGVLDKVTDLVASGVGQKKSSLNNNIFVYYLEKDEAKISFFYKTFNLGQVPQVKEQFPFFLISQLNQGSAFFSSLFSAFEDKPSLRIPIVLDDNYQDRARFYDVIHKNGQCQGLSYTAANLLGKCKSPKSEAFVQLSLTHPYVTQFGLFNQETPNLPDNSGRTNYAMLAMIADARFLGVDSSFDGSKFNLPFTSFDEKTFVKEHNLFLSELGGLENNRSLVLNNNLYFCGDHVSQLLGKGTQDSVFDVGKGKKGIPLVYDKEGQVFLNLRNSLLSDSPFKNYGNFLEIELALFEDLGFPIRTRAFYGNSIYGSGSIAEPSYYELESTYSFYDEKKHSYVKNLPSETPLGVGLHVYGNYNDILQNGNIFTEGFGALGIRIDGSNNTITVPQATRIIANGKDGSAVVFSYGSGNKINVDGRLIANGEDGVAIKANFGSNVHSNLYESRGSYQANRTIDFKTGQKGYDAAISTSIPEELRHPAVDKINISGTVSGKGSAIFMDGSALVKEINLLKRANISGDIVSLWNFETDKSGNLVNIADVVGLMLPLKLQLTKDDLDVYSKEALINNVLSTSINIGADERFLYHDNPHYFGSDPDAYIDIEGKIIGQNINVNVLGGQTMLHGALDINNLYIRNSNLRVDSQSGRNIEVNSLVMDGYGVLDLSNGFKNRLIIDKQLSLHNDSRIRVDADLSGRIIDEFELDARYIVPGRNLNLEPALKYNDLRRLGSDPKALFKFISNFVSSANSMFSNVNIYIPFPKYVWDSSGMYGRAIRCSSRGCRIGEFLDNSKIQSENLSTLQIIFSFCGLILMCGGVYLYFRFSAKGNSGH